MAWRKFSAALHCKGNKPSSCQVATQDGDFWYLRVQLGCTQRGGNRRIHMHIHIHTYVLASFWYIFAIWSGTLWLFGSTNHISWNEHL